MHLYFFCNLMQSPRWKGQNNNKCHLSDFQSSIFIISRINHIVIKLFIKVHQAKRGVIRVFWLCCQSAIPAPGQLLSVNTLYTMILKRMSWRDYAVVIRRLICPYFAMPENVVFTLRDPLNRSSVIQRAADHLWDCRKVLLWGGLNIE